MMWRIVCGRTASGHDNNLLPVKVPISHTMIVFGLLANTVGGDVDSAQAEANANVIQMLQSKSREVPDSRLTLCIIHYRAQ
jgi:hypothetical protein